MKFLKILSLFLLLFVVACSSDDGNEPVQNTNDPNQPADPQGDPQSAGNLIINFTIPAGPNNLQVAGDVQISGNNFTIFFPANSDITALVPTFQLSADAKLFVGTEEIISGQTPINFSSAVNLRVEAQNGDANTYVVQSITNFSSLDNAIENLRTQHNAPGFQVAIVKDERLVYANYYGNASLDGSELVSDDSVFRIASISKPVTVIALLNLVQDGIIGLNDTVFGTNGILGNDFGTPPYGPGIEDIQVIHLIDHLSGWTNNPVDPMFANINWTQQEVINDIVDNRPLETTPGDVYFYSNFGYCVLGRVVEKVTGMSYPEYVKSEILIPAGITTMENAKAGDDKWPNEVEYFSQEAFDPYFDMNVPRMDSHGGWVSSSIDLARLLVRVDGGNVVPDIISSNILATNYLGASDWWFAGSLPGTSAVFGKLGGDYNYVILTNTRSLPDIFQIISDMQSAVQSEIQGRNSWPRYDLF